MFDGYNAQPPLHICFFFSRFVFSQTFASASITGRKDLSIRLKETGHVISVDQPERKNTEKPRISEFRRLETCPQDRDKTRIDCVGRLGGKIFGSRSKCFPYGPPTRPS